MNPAVLSGQFTSLRMCPAWIPKINPGLREDVGCPLSQMGLPAFECRISPSVLHRLPVEQLCVHRENVTASLLAAEGFRCVSFVYACSVLYMLLMCNINLEMRA